MISIEGRPTVHPHWLFHFHVSNLDAAMKIVREAGGTAEEVELPGSGERVAICEDLQGAAFALRR